MPTPILRRILSFPVMLAGCLAVLTVLTARSRFDDPDMWWHLKMGQIVWTTHTIPVSDLFSYTTGHHASIPQEWLAQASIYVAYRLGSYPGLMLWLCLLTAAVLIAGYALCSLYSGNPKVAFLGAMALWLFSTVGIAVRPQLIGYLFLVFELLLIHLGRVRDRRWFLWLPALFALWINCHASFILGIAVAGVYLLASFFEFQMGSLVAQRWNPGCRRMFALALILSAAALFLNPVGISQILYPVNTILHQPLGLASVEEWQPTPMSDPRGLALLAVLLACFLPAVARRSELLLEELLLLALAAWLGVSHLRTLFAFGILAAPILSHQFSTLWDSYSIEKDRIWPNALCLGVSLAIAFLAFPSRQDLQTQVAEHSPVKAVEFLQSSRLRGPMLNEYEFGGYLIWAAPEYPVFVDGRSDVFEWTGILAEFGNWATLGSDPNLLLDKYKIGFCLLARHSPMARVLPLLHDWKMVYSDSNSVIVARTAPGSLGGG